jgi:hypothetical protein
MDRDHWLVGPRAELVERPGNELLASAAFSQQEHCRRRAGHLPNQLEHLLHGRRFPDDVLHAKPRVQLLTQRGVLHLQVLLAQCPGDAHLQLIDLQSPFSDVVIGPLFHRFDSQLLRTVRSHQNANRWVRKRFCPGN